MRKVFKLVAVAAMVTAAMALAADGEKVYQNNCQSCHQPNGMGITGAFPPLVKVVPEILGKGEDGRKLLIHIVLYGMKGQITVDGATYNSQMTAFEKILTDDAQVAAVLDYIAKAWGNDKLLPKDYKPFSPDEVKAERGKGLSAEKVTEEYNKLMSK